MSTIAGSGHRDEVDGDLDLPDIEDPVVDVAEGQAVEAPDVRAERQRLELAREGVGDRKVLRDRVRRGVGLPVTVDVPDETRLGGGGDLGRASRRRRQPDAEGAYA